MSFINIHKKGKWTRDLERDRDREWETRAFIKTERMVVPKSALLITYAHEPAGFLSS